MADRRPLLDALNPPPPTDRREEERFVFGDRPPSPEPAPPRPPATPRQPFTTRIRGDLATALKRASLERQLDGRQPHAVQDILDAALEPWLRDQGHLP